MSDGLVTTLAVATAVCLAAVALIAVAGLARAGFVVANAVAVGLRPSTVPVLAAVKAAGALGLLLGFLGAPWLGLAAGVGLVLFFVGAVAAHVRAGELATIGFPALYLVLAGCAAVYFADAAG